MNRRMFETSKNIFVKIRSLIAVCYKHRNMPFDGPAKGVGDNFMANAGSFPPHQGPSNAMANGPQQVQMNGVSSQQDPNRYHPGYYQQPKQPLPPKVMV